MFGPVYNVRMIEMQLYKHTLRFGELFTRSLPCLHQRVFTTLLTRSFSQEARLSNSFTSVGLGHPPHLSIREPLLLSSRQRALRHHLLLKSESTTRPRPSLFGKYTRHLYSTKARNMIRPIVVAVEGNIGSGKTKMLDFFEKNVPDVETLIEPVHKWRNYNGSNLLGMMYSDPERWSFTFQSYVQLTMAESHQTIQTKPVLMRERSIFSAKYCFVENLYECAKLSKVEYDVLTGWFDWIVAVQRPKVDRIIYLRTTPENCQRRIKERSRDEESSIPLDYLQHLHQLHEDWLINKTNFTLPAPVTVLDANLPLDQMFKIYTEDQHKMLTAG